MPTQKLEIKKRDRIIYRLYKNELSASIIAKKLDLSLRQVYRSLIRQGVSRRSPSEQNSIRFANKPLSFSYLRPRNELESSLEIAALMLYKGEGAKTGFTVDFANSDEVTLVIFLKFLRKICRVDERRIRLYLYCFSNQKPKKLIRYWSKKLNISQRAFTKPYIRKISTIEHKRIMHSGVLHLRYSDKKLLAYILTRIDQIAQKMIN